MKNRNLIPWILSVLIAIFYLAMTSIAFIKYPEPFSPISNWLSDLGNRVQNPVGSIFYNTGIYITGSLLVLFFFSLGGNRIPGKKAQNIMLLLTQAIGIFGSIAMILSGVYSIERPQVHSLFSAFLHISLGTAFGFSVAAFRYFKDFQKWILVIGVLTTVLDLIVSVFFNKTQVLEWPVVSLFLGYCLLLGHEIYRLSKLQKSTPQDA